MFVLLFRYVFGGTSASIPGMAYVNFLLPGIFVQTVVFGSTHTGIGLAEDLSAGIIDRFRSLPDGPLRRCSPGEPSRTWAATSSSSG